MHRLRRHVAAELGAGEADLVDRQVGLVAGFRDRLARAGDAEDTAAGRDELPWRSAVPAWNTSAPVAPATSAPPIGTPLSGASG